MDPKTRWIEVTQIAFRHQVILRQAGSRQTHMLSPSPRPYSHSSCYSLNITQPKPVLFGVGACGHSYLCPRLSRLQRTWHGRRRTNHRATCQAAAAAVPSIGDADRRSGARFNFGDDASSAGLLADVLMQCSDVSHKAIASIARMSRRRGPLDSQYVWDILMRHRASLFLAGMF